MNNIRRLNARRHVHRTYAGLSRDGKTMLVHAYNKTEARDNMRKAGFKPVKITQA